uniref:Uncharacterized protein n=1 Tax=Oryza meridionalis TaxID=40149 RepID=A0A0E0C5N0_9ORYZ
MELREIFQRPWKILIRLQSSKSSMVSTLQGDENEMTTWRPSCPADCLSRFAPRAKLVQLGVLVMAWRMQLCLRLSDDSSHDDGGDESDHNDTEGAAMGEATTTLEGWHGLELASVAPRWADPVPDDRIQR